MFLDLASFFLSAIKILNNTLSFDDLILELVDNSVKDSYL